MYEKTENRVILHGKIILRNISGSPAAGFTDFSQCRCVQNVKPLVGVLALHKVMVNESEIELLPLNHCVFFVLKYVSCSPCG